MFPELRSYLDELESTAISTGEFLRKLNGARTRLRNKILEAQEQTKYMRNEVKYVADQKPQIISDARKVSKDILYNHALAALRINTEFDDEVYRIPLLTAIESDDTYLVRTSGAGFKSTISVDINLDKSAGRLNIWSSAIKAARSSLGILVPRQGSKNFEKKAAAASRAWAGIYSRRSEEYYTTIETRLGLSAKPAPFWSIINFGTPPGMKSDRGGYPTPKNKSTNFLDKAEKEVNRAIKGFFTTLKENYDKAFLEYDKFLEEALARQARLDEMADRIRMDRSAIRQLEKELGLNMRETDRNKLELAVNDVRKNLTSRKTFEIGIRGSRKRISRGTIERFYL